MADPNTQRLETKLSELRQVYTGQPELQRAITDTEAAMRRNIKKAKLIERPEVKEMVDEAVKAIQDISFLLANDETLTEAQRAVLFAEKKAHKFWLERLDGTKAMQALGFIEETVDSLTPPKKK